MGRFRWVVVSALVLALGAPSAGSADPRPSERAALGATLKASVRQAEEGDRIVLTARIKAPSKALRATLLERQVSIVGDVSWEQAKSVKVRGRGKVSFAVVATGPNADRYRLSVTYAGKRAAVASKPISVTVWSWIPLAGYRPYYETDSVGPIEVDLNGRRYEGWGPFSYSRAGSWEERFTPGRHCKAFRGVLGLSDISEDGSSGAIGFTADDGAVYSSPPLIPGTELQVNVPLASPYRFGIQALDTSPGDLESWPVIGDPAFLCTGV
jgi:hypothetical protein